MKVRETVSDIEDKFFLTKKGQYVYDHPLVRIAVERIRIELDIPIKSYKNNSDNLKRYFNDEGKKKKLRLKANLLRKKLSLSPVWIAFIEFMILLDTVNPPPKYWIEKKVDKKSGELTVSIGVSENPNFNDHQLNNIINLELKNYPDHLDRETEYEAYTVTRDFRILELLYKEHKTISQIHQIIAGEFDESNIDDSMIRVYIKRANSRYNITFENLL